MDPRNDSAAQVTGQANEISREMRQAESDAARPDSPSGATAMGAGPTPPGDPVNDTLIVAGLKARFAADDDISAMAVDIDSKDGMVTLSGTVPNSDAKVRADRIARGMEEVKSVNNQLEVKAG